MNDTETGGQLGVFHGPLQRAGIVKLEGMKWSARLKMGRQRAKIVRCWVIHEDSRVRLSSEQVRWQRKTLTSQCGRPFRELRKYRRSASRHTRDTAPGRVPCRALERAGLSIQPSSHESIQAGILNASAGPARKSHSERDTQAQHKFSAMSATKSAECVLPVDNRSV